MSAQACAPGPLTGDGNDGFPSEMQFREQMEDYLGGLNAKKRAKALMSREMYATILAVLLEPHSTAHATAQFRFWAKRMFRLVTTPHANLVAHENRPVAVKDQIYHILVGCHGDTNHSGRDKTSAQVRRYYSWLPKELVSRFVKMCPTCIHKRRQQQPYLSDSYVPPGTFGIPRRIGVVATQPTSYSEEDPESPERGYEQQVNYHDAKSYVDGQGVFAAFTPTRRGSGESEVYDQPGQYDESGLESSPTNYLNGTDGLAYANYFLQGLEGASDDASLYSLPVPPSTNDTPTRGTSQAAPPPVEQQFFYQDENGQTYAYDHTGALVPQIAYSGLPMPADYSNYGENVDSSEQPQDLSDFSTWQLPPPEVDNSLEYPSQEDLANAQAQQDLLYELPPLPASAPPYQMTHFPDLAAEPRRGSLPLHDQTAGNIEFSGHDRERTASQKDQQSTEPQPLGLALYTESPSTNSNSNPPTTVRRAKPPPLDLGKSSNLFPTGLDPAFRRSATTGVPQYLSANYNLDHSAPLSAPLQRTSHTGGTNQFNAFRDMLPSPGPSSACSTTSTIFSSASSLPLTPGTSCSTIGSESSNQSNIGCLSGENGTWGHQDSEQLEQAIRLLYDSHIETSGSGGGVGFTPLRPNNSYVGQDGSSSSQQQGGGGGATSQPMSALNHPQPIHQHQQHDALLAHFLGGQVNLEQFDDGMFAFSGALPTTSMGSLLSQQQHQQSSNDVGPDEEGDEVDDTEEAEDNRHVDASRREGGGESFVWATPDRLRRERMRTRTVSAGPQMMRTGGIGGGGGGPGSLDYATKMSAYMNGTSSQQQQQSHSVTRTPTKDLRYMPY